MGSKNHEVVPTPLIVQIAGLWAASGVHKSISVLAKYNLISKVKNIKYDGYRLTYGGLDYLALHTYEKQKTVYSVGNRIGVGKEGDIMVVHDNNKQQRILKLHRLGRISFRSIKTNRDYLRNRSSASWMYMSRLAAMKEYAFMKALWERGFSVPEPISQNRHSIVMSYIEAFPLRQVAEVPHPASLYSELIEMILALAEVGLIHCDFNEFNILIKEELYDAEGSPTTNEDSVASIKLVPILIDFPQMVSVDHPNAESYFDRDVNCVKSFFRRKFGFTSDDTGPTFASARKRMATRKSQGRLDVDVEASGFSRKMAKELEAYMKEVGADGVGLEKPPGSVENEDPSNEEQEGEEDNDEDEDEDSGSEHETLGTDHDAEEAEEQRRLVESGNFKTVVDKLGNTHIVEAA